MSEENKTGKWAGEVFDFVRVFKKVGKSAFGLLISEIGWIFTLMLVSRITPWGDDPTPPRVRIPGGNSWAVTDLLIPGMMIVFLLWLLGSGFYLYLWVPISTVLKYFILVVVVLITAIAWALNRAISPITRLVEKNKIDNYWTDAKLEAKREILEANERVLLALLRAYVTANDVKRIKNDFGSEVVDALFSDDHETEQRERIIDEALEKRALRDEALKHIRFREMFLSDWVWSVVKNFVISVYSQANIGIAPILSYNYDEDQSSARLESQIFSIGIEWIRWALKDIDALQYIEFRVLPEHLVPSNAVVAERLRAWLNLDVLIWGSYISESRNEIWINTTVRLPTAKGEDGDEDKPRYDIIPDIFLADFKVDPLVLVIDQSIPWQTHATLALAIILTLQSRQPEEGKRTIDRLNEQGDRIDQIIIHLLRCHRPHCLSGGWPN